MKEELKKLNIKTTAYLFGQRDTEHNRQQHARGQK